MIMTARDKRIREYAVAEKRFLALPGKAPRDPHFWRIRLRLHCSAARSEFLLRSRPAPVA